jgi:hypothetical protein
MACVPATLMHAHVVQSQNNLHIQWVRSDPIEVINAWPHQESGSAYHLAPPRVLGLLQHKC